MSGALWLSTRTPEEYAERLVIPNDVRLANLQKVEVKRELFLEEAETKPEWSFTLTEVEANSWLASDEFHENVAWTLPPEISNPRVQLKDNEVVLAFQVSHEDFKGVVTAPLKVESISDDQVQIRIERVTTGLLPLSWQQILEGTLAEQRESLPVGITWNEEETDDRGTLITVDLDQFAELNWQLDKLELGPGYVYVKGSRDAEANQKKRPQSPTPVSASSVPDPEPGNAAPGG
ncbi:MAG: hypothetical protein CMJ46_03695 [Planctomyces sp.]|nr:hypothetical protein [Planctomyces sp.]